MTIKSHRLGMGPGGNYLAKAVLLARTAGVHGGDLDVRHDAWCALLRFGQACNCDPDVTVRRIL